MIYIRLFIFLIFFGSDFVFAQKIITKKSVLELQSKAKNYYEEGNFEKTLYYSKLTLKSAEILNDDIIISECYRLISRTFKQLSESDLALLYANKGLAYANKTENDSIKMLFYNGIGNIYSFEKKDLKKALENYLISIRFSKKIKDTANLVLTNSNIAWSYFAKNKFKEGFPYLEFTNKYNQKFGNQKNYNSILMLNGMYYSYLKDFKTAKKYFLKGIENSKNLKISNHIENLYYEYSKVLYKEGDYKNAYDYNIKSSEIKDLMYSQDKLRKANIEGVNIELDVIKRELNKIEIDNQKQTLIIKKSRTINILAVILGLIMVLLLFSILRNARLNKLNSSRLQKKNFQLKVAVDKSRVATKAKSLFVSTVSHELRTPLYGVIGITDIIYEEHKELIDNKHLDALKFSTKYLLSLINDILEIDKIEESRIVLEKNSFNLKNEIESIKNSLQFIADKNNISFTSDIDSNIPKIVISDQMRLSQILMNLITNALKFTKNGEVKICVSLEKMIDEVAFVKFEIIDNGIGISKENQEKIFDKFTQIERKEQDYQGTGLGLSIVKRLLYLFKTEIILESEEDKGSKFTFTIGFLTGDHQIIEKKSEISNVELTKDLRILVVEDNKINQLVTKKIMEQNNHFCKLVSNGMEAIEVLKVEHFDLILMDINMPVLNGFETTEIIRQMEIYIPVIALTAYNRKRVLQQAKNAGIDAVITKPFESSQLFNEIQNQLELRK